MGIEGIENLTPFSEDNRHEFIDFPVGNFYRGKSCVRCGRVKDNPIHIKEDEEKNVEG